MFMSDLKVRAKLKKKKPEFKRQVKKNLLRLNGNWRRPKGNQSKQRMHRISRGFIPNVGYGSPSSVRGLHPCGLRDVLVHNAKELDGMDAKSQACRIASGVGVRKREQIVKKASELKIKVLNPTKVRPVKTKKVKGKPKETK